MPPFLGLLETGLGESSPTGLTVVDDDRGCLPYDGRPGGPSGGSRGYRVGLAGREQRAHRSQGIYNHIRRLGERDR